MTPEEAEVIFNEFGEVLANQWLAKPEKYGPNLRCVSKAGLRKAILMWVAKKKFEGIDILFRQELLPGQQVAVLELAQQVWPLASAFGPLKNGVPSFDSTGDRQEAARRHDEFVEFLQKLNTHDPDYWRKVNAKLS